MKRPPSPTSALLACCLLFAAPHASARQTQTQAQTEPKTPARTSAQDARGAEDEVVRITSNLVQVDLVVTDKNGRQVTDLRPEEVEIFEDGRAQKITNFSYVSLGPVAPSPSDAPKKRDKNEPPAPGARLRREQVRRTIALVVDDLGASFESIAYVRQALKKFVDEQMQPGDLVAVMRTSGGMGALQQFTSDKRMLYAAIERVRWNALGRGGVGAFAPIEADPFSRARAETSAVDERSERAARQAREDFDEFREQVFSVGTLGAVNFIVRGLGELPGRKAVILLSDGFTLFNRQGRNERVLEALQRLTDQANRASVVIYTIDARGLQYGGLTAADDTGDLSVTEIEEQLAKRRDFLFQTQSGLQYLAEQTGGFAVRNTNDISHGVGRALEDQQGYYLVGYRPGEETFDAKTGRPRFHRLKAKVTRAGARVRVRSGFYGVGDEEARPPLRTRDEHLVAALSSPFSSGDIGLRLTSLFANDEKAGSFMRSLLHIEARNLSFAEQPDGWHKAVLDILAVTFGETGRVVDEVNVRETIRTRGETFERVKKYGLTFTLHVPVKKPGAYQLRAAVYDAAGGRTGSANQFIEVPNLSKDRLALSGVVASASPLEAKAGVKASAAADAQQQPSSNPQAGPAVRRFRQRTTLDYYFQIYNARLERATGRPQLQAQVRLLRDGKQVYAGQWKPIDPAGQADMKRLLAGGRMTLGTELQPGEYVLQVVVADALAEEKRRTATQWIDFEIVP